MHSAAPCLVRTRFMHAAGPRGRHFCAHFFCIIFPHDSPVDSPAEFPPDACPEPIALIFPIDQAGRAPSSR
ncbi:hypothetical protein PSAC2689_30252 [Paraburkholderia sacchari]